MKKIIQKIKKLFVHKKLTERERIVKKFEHLGIDSRSEEGRQLQISFEKTPIITSNRTNPELGKLKETLKKSYTPPEDYESECRVAMAQELRCSLEPKKFSNGRMIDMVNKEKGIIMDAKYGSCDGSGKMSNLVHSVDKMLEQVDDMKLKIIAVIFHDKNLAKFFIRTEVEKGRLEKRLEKYPGLEFQIWHFDPSENIKPGKLYLK